jgi:two-component system NtrC family sensor kinase
LFGEWPIRAKFLVGLGLLLLLIAILSGGGLYSTYTYRSLVKDLSWRAEEAPLAGDLGSHVAELRILLESIKGLHSIAPAMAEPSSAADAWRQAHAGFDLELTRVEKLLLRYRHRLESEYQAGSPMSDNQRERAAVRKIEQLLGRVRSESQRQALSADPPQLATLEQDLEQLQSLVTALPSPFYSRMAGFADEVRSQYRALILGMTGASISAALVFAVFVRLFHRWISRPLGILIAGSRKVAGGQFGHRIVLQTRDEMAELADALNAMTERFRAIRDDLDRQVQERTKQVVRNEQLASVGFLAAGVAHEINNPLASIAMCAESLEDRLPDVLDAANADRDVVVHYLRMIQSEAFRCKEITEKLLDFSRIGPAKRQPVELGELVQDVIEMVSHLGKYRGREIRLRRHEPVCLPLNAQEIKQVVLNLLTNALDSVEEGGLVRVEVARRDRDAELTVTDNGIGMNADVLEHIFEPFFTRRKEGQGTGLGLSISYRIVADHGGTMEAQSDGPGRGAAFRVRLPWNEHAQASDRSPRAA